MRGWLLGTVNAAARRARWVTASILVVIAGTSLLSVEVPPVASASTSHPVPGHACSPLGRTSVYRSRRYTCVRKGKRHVWNSGVAVKSTTTTTTTTTAPSTAGLYTPPGCPSTYLFADLSSVSGAGPGYAKPSLSASCSADTLSVSSNGMPGYAFTPVTPNPLLTQSWHWSVPTDPQLAATPSTLVNVMGAIAFTITGLPIYGPEEGAQPAAEAYGDPVYNKLLDDCGGHTGPAGEYHYHEIIATAACGLSSTIIGYAFDGFPIYSNPGDVYQSGYVRTGDPTTNDWNAYTYVGGGAHTLDRCNGTTVDGQYRYYVTPTFPYVLGCYSGTPMAQSGNRGMEPSSQSRDETLGQMIKLVREPHSHYC